MDKIDRVSRSKIMSRVRSKNTAPELFVRSLVHGLGYRFRLHGKGLPGSPDMVFLRRKAVIFVNGCFWHLHSCGKYRLPQSNTEFWFKKLAENKMRDQAAVVALNAMGWKVFTVWECELKNRELLRGRVVEFLGPTRQLKKVQDALEKGTRG